MSVVRPSFDTIGQAFTKATANLNALEGQDLAIIFQDINNPTASLPPSQVASLIGNVIKVCFVCYIDLSSQELSFFLDRLFCCWECE
jgi:hypothetical protein